MPSLEFIGLSGLLFFCGLGVAAHYHLIANFLTIAPFWIRWLSALTAGMGFGMMFCALTGSIHYGLALGLVANAGMILIQLAAWRAGAHISDAFARSAYFRLNRKTMIRDWEIAGEDLGESFRLFDEELAKQKEKAC